MSTTPTPDPTTNPDPPVKPEEFTPGDATQPTILPQYRPTYVNGAFTLVPPIFGVAGATMAPSDSNTSMALTVMESPPPLTEAITEFRQGAKRRRDHAKWSEKSLRHLLHIKGMELASVRPSPRKDGESTQALGKWELIASQMEAAGFKYSWRQCKDKWNNEITLWKKVSDYAKSETHPYFSMTPAKRKEFCLPTDYPRWEYDFFDKVLSDNPSFGDAEDLVDPAETKTADEDNSVPGPEKRQKTATAAAAAAAAPLQEPDILSALNAAFKQQAELLREVIDVVKQSALENKQLVERLIDSGTSNADMLATALAALSKSDG